MSNISYVVPNKSSLFGFSTSKVNRHFYENLTHELYVKFASLSGLQDGQDVLAIQSYVKDANTVLEIGAGFGRAVDQMIELNPTAEVTALEICNSMCTYLNTRYMDQAQVRVVHSGFLEYETVQSYSLITMLWSTLTVFPPLEQQECLIHCRELLEKGGHLVIDLYGGSKDTVHSGLHQMDRFYVAEFSGYKQYGYLPEHAELLQMAEIAGLKLVEVCTLDTGNVLRNLFIFQA